MSPSDCPCRSTGPLTANGLRLSDPGQRASYQGHWGAPPRPVRSLPWARRLCRLAGLRMRVRSDGFADGQVRRVAELPNNR